MNCFVVFSAMINETWLSNLKDEATFAVIEKLLLKKRRNKMAAQLQKLVKRMNLLSGRF